MQLRDDDSDDTHHERKQDDSRAVGGLAVDSHSPEGALSDGGFCWKCEVALVIVEECIEESLTRKP